MSTIKLEIIYNKEESIYIEQFCEKNKHIQKTRNNIIDNIIYDKVDNININNIFYINDKFGSIYQSKYRKTTHLSSVSHTIKRIEKSNEKIYGIISILSTASGKTIKSNRLDLSEKFQLILKPVFSDINTISTFDIDFKMN